jgi:hypothetical protein
MIGRLTMAAFQPFLFGALVAGFVFPGYVLACRVYARFGDEPLATERAAVGAVVAFGLLSLIALPAWVFNWSFGVIFGLYATASALLVRFVPGAPSVRDALAAAGRGIVRDWLLLLGGVLLAAGIVPFARLYGDGQDVLYFIGVVRRYMAFGHPSMTNVIYGNGTPDGLNGVNLWLLFMSAIGWAARADVLKLFAWAAGGLSIVALLSHRLLYLAICDDDRAARVMAMVTSVAMILLGGHTIHGINVDLLPNQSHGAAYPKVITQSVLVPLFMTLLVRFIRSHRWMHVASLVVVVAISSQIHPLEALWMSWAWLAIAVVLFWPMESVREARMLVAGLALLAVGIAPYVALYGLGAHQLHADPIYVELADTRRGVDMAVHLIGPSSTVFRVDPAFIAETLFPGLVAVLLIAAFGIDRRIPVVLAAAVLSPALLGLFELTTTRLGRVIALVNVVKFAISGYQLGPFLYGAAGALALGLLTRRRRRVVALLISTAFVLGCAVWVAANHGRFSVDYKIAVGARDLFVESAGTVARAMGRLPPGTVIFNGNAELALRQVVALSDGFPYLLENTKQIACGLSPHEASARDAVVKKVMDPGRSNVDRYHDLQEAGVRYLLVPKRAFAGAVSSPLFEWVAESEPGIEEEPYVFGRTRTPTEMRSLLNEKLTHLDEPATPFPAIADRLMKAIDLADTVNDESALIPYLGRFSARSPIEAYALLNIVEHQSQAAAVRARAADLAMSLDSIFEPGGSAPLQIVSFVRDGSMSSLRPEYHPDALADGDPTTGIVMTGTHGAFGVTADLGAPALVDGVAVTTAFGNEHYSFPRSAIYVSLDGHTWASVGTVEAITGSGVVVLQLRSIKRFVRYIRLAIPPAGNIAIAEIGIEGRRIRAAIKWPW